MKKLLITLALMFALSAYAQSPWRGPIRSPEDVRGMRAELDALTQRVDVLEAREAILSAALLDLYYDKRLALSSGRVWAAQLPDGRVVFVMDPTEPDGDKSVPRDDYVAELDNEQIPQVGAHLTALETP